MDMPNTLPIQPSVQPAQPMQPVAPQPFSSTPPFQTQASDSFVAPNLVSNTDQPSSSYVDDYAPPAATPAITSPITTGPTFSDAPATDMSSMPSMDTPPAIPVEEPFAPLSDPEPTAPAAMPSDTAPTEQTEPTATVVEPALSSSSTQGSSVSPVSQALEDQNIFQLLGITDGTPEEREEFLDELQQVIWEDFLENDVELLVTEEEMVELKKIMERKDLDDNKLQEEIITYLEKLVPDLEEIMLEKALELKADMVKERIAGMREYYAGKDAQLQELAKTEAFIQDNQWRDAASLLNGMTD